MKKIQSLIIAIILVCMSFSYSSGENSKRRQTSKKSRTEKVKTALSRFVHGVQYELPGVVGSVYRIETEAKDTSEDNKPLSRDERIRKFMDEFSGVEGNPVVCLVDYDMNWLEDGKAIVNCRLAWHIVDSKKRKIIFATRERFEFIDSKGKYIIKGAETTPVVINYLSQPAKFREEIRKAENKIRGNYEFKTEDFK